MTRLEMPGSFRCFYCQTGPNLSGSPKFAQEDRNGQWPVWKLWAAKFAGARLGHIRCQGLKTADLLTYKS